MSDTDTELFKQLKNISDDYDIAKDCSTSEELIQQYFKKAEPLLAQIDSKNKNKEFIYYLDFNECTVYSTFIHDFFCYQDERMNRILSRNNRGNIQSTLSSRDEENIPTKIQLGDVDIPIPTETLGNIGSFSTPTPFNLVQDIASDDVNIVVANLIQDIELNDVENMTIICDRPSAAINSELIVPIQSGLVVHRSTDEPTTTRDNIDISELNVHNGQNLTPLVRDNNKRTEGKKRLKELLAKISANNLNINENSSRYILKRRKGTPRILSIQRLPRILPRTRRRIRPQQKQRRLYIRKCKEYNLIYCDHIVLDAYNERYIPLCQQNRYMKTSLDITSELPSDGFITSENTRQNFSTTTKNRTLYTIHEVSETQITSPQRNLEFTNIELARVLKSEQIEQQNLQHSNIIDFDFANNDFVPFEQIEERNLQPPHLPTLYQCYDSIKRVTADIENVALDDFNTSDSDDFIISANTRKNLSTISTNKFYGGPLPTIHEISERRSISLQPNDINQIGDNIILGDICLDNNHDISDSNINMEMLNIQILNGNNRYLRKLRERDPDINYVGICGPPKKRRRKRQNLRDPDINYVGICGPPKKRRRKRQNLQHDELRNLSNNDQIHDPPDVIKNMNNNIKDNVQEFKNLQENFMKYNGPKYQNLLAFDVELYTDLFDEDEFNSFINVFKLLITSGGNPVSKNILFAHELSEKEVKLRHSAVKSLTDFQIAEILNDSDGDEDMINLTRFSAIKLKEETFRKSN